MEYYFLAAILLVSILFLIANAVIFFKIRRILSDFITPEKRGEPSQLDNFVNTFAHNIGQAVFNQARALMGANQSMVSKAHNAVDSAMTSDMIAAANPAMAAVLEAMPGLKKALSKYPGATEYAIEKLMSKAGSVKQVQPGGNGHDVSTKLSL